MKKILRIIFILLFILITISISYIFFKYFSWRKGFFATTENIYCSKDIVMENYDIDSKIKKFVFSDNDGYMELSTKEVIVFLLDNIEPAGSLELDDICISSGKGLWKVYLNLKVDSLNLPWFEIDIVKDQRETAELYVDDIFVGDMNIPPVFSKGILSSMNKGVSDALLLVSENNFIGRSINNIELLENGVVIR